MCLVYRLGTTERCFKMLSKTTIPMKNLHWRYQIGYRIDIIDDINFACWINIVDGRRALESRTAQVLIKIALSMVHTSWIGRFFGILKMSLSFHSNKKSISEVIRISRRSSQTILVICRISIGFQTSKFAFQSTFELKERPARNYVELRFKLYKF